MPVLISSLGFQHIGARVQVFCCRSKLPSSGLIVVKVIYMPVNRHDSWYI